MTKSALGPRSFLTAFFDRPGRRRTLIKTLLVMKLTILLLTVVLFSAHANTVAQTVTISGNDLTYKQLFTAIEKQTGYVVLYGPALISGKKTFSLSVSKLPLQEFLDMILKDQALEYEIEDKTIFLSEKPRPALSFDQLTQFPIKIRVTGPNGNPLAGASVMNKSTKHSGVTDAEGVLNLNVAVGDVIEITFIGYEKQSIALKDDTASINVTLKPSETSLDEITVSTGYWTTEKRKSVGNIVKVSAKDIEKQPVTSPLMALQGLVPGLEVSPTSGTPGTAVKFQIRGLNSVRRAPSTSTIDGNFPLIVIDGIAIDPTPLSSRSNSLATKGFDPLNGLNIANIESIQVLKDADATSIYGSRGANGVILITTKNRKTAKGLTADVNYYRGVGEVVQRIDMLSRDQYLAMRHEAFVNDNETPNEYNAYDFMLYDTTRETDWQDVLLGHTSNIEDMQIGFSAGNGRTSFGFTGGYHKETLLYSNDFNYKRYNGSININHLSDDQRFSAGIVINYGRNNHKLFNSSLLIGNSLQLAPTAPPLYNPDGSLNWAPLPPFNVSTWSNPMSWLRSPHLSTSNTFNSNIILSYKILKGLSVKANVGYSTVDQEESVRKTLSSLSPEEAPFARGSNTVTMNTRNAWIVEPQITYSATKNDHSFDVLLGGTFQESAKNETRFNATGYSSDAQIGNLQAATTITNNTSSSEYRYTAAYGRIQYGYADRWILNLTGRRDGSSRFGPGKRFGNFGAIGFGYIFSEEPFIKRTLPFISFGKFRSSYGTTGNDQIGDSKYLQTYQLATRIYGGASGYIPSGLFNQDYSWEITRKLEAAIEMGLLKDHISFELAWYKNRSSNQLVNYPLPSITGFTSVLMNFDALVQNTGWEFILNTKNVSGQKINWSTSFNLSFPQNKLIKFDNIENSSYRTLLKVGEPLIIKRGYLWKGVNPQTGVHEFEDLNHDGNITSTDDYTFLQPMVVKFFGGLNNIISYSAFELSFLFQFSDRYAEVIYETIPGLGPFGNQPAYVMNRWQKPGDITSVQKFTQSYSSDAGIAYNERYNFSDGVIQHIFFARLKTLSLSYSLQESILKRLKITSCKMYIQGQNLLTFSNSKRYGWDPETLYSIPPLRILSAGIQLRF